MMAGVESLLWPASRLGEALVALTGVPARNSPETKNWDADWLESAALSLGFEAQPVETPYADLEDSLRSMGPALLRVPAKGGEGFLAILPNCKIITPDLRKIRIAPSAIRSALCADIETPAIPQIEETLERAQVPRSRQARSRDAILRERFSATRIRGMWLLRLPPGANFWRQLRQARVPQRLLTLAGAHTLQYVLWILAWWVVGENLLNGRADTGWLLLWALLLLTLVPLRVLITWLQGRIAFGAGARLKQRLFLGALRLEPDSLRHQGAGQLLGRVLESEAVEALALSGGLLALVALVELSIAAFVLGRGAGGALHPALLTLWFALAAAIAWRYFERNRDWTSVRLDMTHDLVESMAGHRTRLAQLAPDRWHDGEDEALELYLKASKAMDSATAALIALVPRGWLVLGLLGLAPAFIRGVESPARIAIAVGGILLAYRAWRRLASGAWQLAGAAVAWRRVAGLYRAAARPEEIGSLNVPSPTGSPNVIDARDLVFRFSERTEPVLDRCTLQISAGDRLVLEGASGSGKSTLVSLLTGLREPLSGQVLSAGLDRRMLGSRAWRRRIAAAPQFHENHVLAATFQFNLFLGRPQALSSPDLKEAEEICGDLGLSSLLDRMPAGMLQMVGETGWQLSHGERSRLYIARALLQDSEVVVLDESFAALDPENLERAVQCVVRRARSLLVIAHR
jgi:ATP-binding cassette subfamily B protein